MDGDFLDTGELVYSADAQKSNVSGTITIPAGLTGETRMRISMKYNAAPTSCEQFIYGEVEDYTLSLTIPVPQPPVADFSGSPTTVIAGNSVQFTDKSLNNPTSWSWIFNGGTPVASAAQNPLITYNSVGTYPVTLTVTNGLGSDTKTIDAYITVVAAGAYCSSHSNSNALDWISRVDISTFNNPSGASFYSDFTGMTITLTPGSTNSLVLTPYSTTQRQYWRIWIDFNGDGDFEDTGEQAFSANNKKGVVSGSLIIPSTASGQTRMRITVKDGGAPAPCEIFQNGEVEDYTVNFNQAAVLTQENNLKLEIYPNPASNLLNVVVTGKAETVNIKVYNALGQIIDDFDVKNNRTTINLSNFQKGIYFIGADNGIQNTLKKFIKE
jgi:PKD repeat protein